MNETEHILIVDDDERLSRLVTNYLQGEGFKTGTAVDGVSMWKYLETKQPDLILLDVMLPGVDGITLARELRSKSNVGIIILTGKNDKVDTIVGLEVGADDYVTKPFDERELLARIHSVLRRLSADTGNGQAASQDRQVAEFDGWLLDLSAYKFTSPLGENIPLTTHEFRLLKIFVENSGRVLTRDQILQKLSSRDWTPDNRSVDVMVGRLRKALHEDTANPTLIHTIRNAGYQFTAKVTFRTS